MNKLSLPRKGMSDYGNQVIVMAFNYIEKEKLYVLKRTIKF
jgi:hypothetical protein